MKGFTVPSLSDASPVRTITAVRQLAQWAGGQPDFRFASGTYASGDVVTFAKAYETPPVVLTTASVPVSTTVTETGFTVSHGSASPVVVSWVAIG